MYNVYVGLEYTPEHGCNVRSFITELILLFQYKVEIEYIKFEKC